MGAEIIPFDFEEQAVRVVLRGDEPWFVAADVCRVLEIQNVTQAVQRLDDDEVTLCQTEGSHRPMNLVSESGLYALVLRSDKPAARRFRKWITAEVLPALRRTGRYDLASEPAAPDPVEDPMGPRDWLALVREARLLGGTGAGRRMWALSPLPPLFPDRMLATPGDGSGADCLRHLLACDTICAGMTIAELVAAARAGDAGAYRTLARAGLRAGPEDLFVAGALPHGARLFDGTDWSGGRHRAALLGLPGARPGQLSLAGVATRGVHAPLPSARSSSDEGEVAHV